MKFYYISISSLSFFPVFKYILKVFLKIKNDNKNNHHLVESYLKGFPEYSSQVCTHYYYRFNNINHFNNMSFQTKIRRYLYVLFYIIKAILSKKTVIYTSDYQVLFIVFKLFKLLGKSNVKLIYHQFELIELEHKRNILQIISSNKHYIDLAVFPEINRLNYFVDNTGFPIKRTLLFPNTCEVNNVVTSKNKILKEFNDDDIVIAHVGNVGFNHFLLEIISCFKKLNVPDNYKLVFIGKQSKDLEIFLQNNAFTNIYFYNEIPHNELSSIYNFIDYGLILYKPIDLNFDFCAPNKLYEYWAHGVPVMAHCLRGLENIITHNLGSIIDFNKIQLNDILKINKLTEEKRNMIKEEFRIKFEVTYYQNQLNQKLKDLLS
ncbi:MAG: hypothetical protein KatS3mg002_1314 [Candidatus Woesearchaeota archaeon]|nr:MAG: hypothetical protein KatS3mg002_1314 [Candidatus Woesearchaeota archaeon]